MNFKKNVNNNNNSRTFTLSDYSEKTPTPTDFPLKWFSLEHTHTHTYRRKHSEFRKFLTGNSIIGERLQNNLTNRENFICKSTFTDSKSKKGVCDR